MKINFVVSAIVLSVMVFVSSVSAGPPKPNVYDGGNKWKITFYNDSTGTHNQWATQEICFLPYTVKGSSIQGKWYSTSFPNWNGRYYQEGDEVKMTGDYAKDVGHDHMTFVHTTRDVPGSVVRGMPFGDWTEWWENGRYGRIIGWGNAKLERTGRCRFPHCIDNIKHTSVLAPKSLEKLEYEVLDISPLAPKSLEKLEEEVLEMSSSLPDRLTVKGDIANSPGQTGLESIDEYQLRTGVE